MTGQTLVRLVRARYRLQWARVRQSPLHVAVFLAAQGLLLVFLIAMAGTGLLSAMAAAQVGRVESIARVMLGSVFLNALVASVVLGFGMSQVFSDAMLRRYPLSATDRFAARQLLALFEPLWLLSLALYVGAGVGFSLLGVSPPWLAFPAVLLLASANYLLARLLVTLTDRAMGARSGRFVLFALFNVAALLPLAFSIAVERSPQARALLSAVMDLMPHAAGAAMLGGSAAPVHAMLLIGWALVPAAVLLLVERRPPPAVRKMTGASILEGPCDRLASAAPPRHAPLVSKTLRYFLRNARVRMNLFVGVLITAFFLMGTGRTPGQSFPLTTALVLSAFIGSIPTLELDLNLFGYERHGMRRLLIVPLGAGAVLRTISLTSLAFGAAYAAVALALLSLVAPVLSDPRALAVAMCSALAGLLLLRGVAAMTSVLLPRAGEYGVVFRNQGGFGAFVALVAGGALVIGPMVSMRTWIESGAALQYWWAAPVVPGACGLVYAACLTFAGTLFERMRERVLETVEQRR